MQDHVRIHLSALCLIDGRAYLALDAAAAPSCRHLHDTAQVMLVQAIDRWLKMGGGAGENGLRITLEVMP